MKNIKKLSAILLLFSFLLFTVSGCGINLSESDYRNDSTIAKISDSYSKTNSILNSTEDRLVFTCASFKGIQTLFVENSDDEQSASYNISMSVEEGMGKLVLVNDAGDVTVLCECSEDSNQFIDVVTVNLSAGQNRIKFVGKDCKGISLEMTRAEDI